MRGALLLAAAALVGVSAAKASEYDFNFSGPNGVTASGYVTVASGATGRITSISGTSGGAAIDPSTLGASSSVVSYTSPTSFQILLSYSTTNPTEGYLWGVYDNNGSVVGTLTTTTAQGGVISIGPATGAVDPAPAPLAAPGVGVLSFSFLAAAGLWSRIKTFAGSTLAARRRRAARA